MSQYTAQDHDEPIVVAAYFRDESGNEIVPSSIPEWGSNDPTVAKVTSTTADGLKGLVTFGRPGTATISVYAEGPNDSKLVAEGVVRVEPGEAAKAELTFSPNTGTDAYPETQPTPPPVVPSAVVTPTTPAYPTSTPDPAATVTSAPDAAKVEDVDTEPVVAG